MRERKKKFYAASYLSFNGVKNMKITKEWLKTEKELINMKCFFLSAENMRYCILVAVHTDV